MKKEILILLLILSTQLALAANLEIEKIDRGSVVISELNNPAKFEFIIKNNGPSDNFEIYSLLGVSMSPKGTFELPTGTSKLQVDAYPSKSVRKNNANRLYQFEYELRGQETGIFKDTLQIRIVELKNAISAKAEKLRVNDETANITIINVENTNLNDLKLRIKSAFFDEEKIISLAPYEKVSLEMPIDRDKIKKLIAGQYIVTVEVNLESASTKIETMISYLEKEDFSVKTTTSGFIIRKKTIEKTNEGNVANTARIDASQNILTRLFTTHSAEPVTAQKKGFFVNYAWEKELNPSESFSITLRTNYTLPLVLLLMVALIAFLVSLYSRTNLILSKEVAFVRTKGGEFALKVRVHVKARKHLRNIKITDRLPHSTKLYEKYGIKPDKTDEYGRLFWNIDKLNAGEQRVFSYVVYSKLKIFGRFELPTATATYEEDNKMKTARSNKTFFVSEAGRVE